MLATEKDKAKYTLTILSNVSNNIITLAFDKVSHFFVLINKERGRVEGLRRD